ncbi:MAG: MFS transporter, partial [Alistipes sp.]|nr:MFS transporter [Alistipes sp.]
MERHGKIALWAWLPVFGLTCAAFVFNTSEFLPIGLLSDIARDFAVTEARAGMLLTGYAWVVALASLPLMLLCSRVESRRLLIAVLALFVASHLLSSVASSYGMLMAARMGVACSHALFWSIASPLAVRIAPPGRQSAALGLVVTGTAVAMIAGLPLGRIVGLHAGWRMTFFYIALLSTAILGLVAAVFPRVPGSAVSWRGALASVAGDRTLPTLYLLTLASVPAP